MDKIKVIKCPICEKEGEIVAHQEEASIGMLEDIPGYTVATFECESCGFKERSSLDKEEGNLEERTKELEEILAKIQFVKDDFRMTKKLLAYGTLLLRKMGSYESSLREVQEWLSAQSLNNE